jgi:hypothetical protein
MAVATGWMATVQFLAEANFSFLCSIQSGSGAHPASYSVGTRGDFPRGNAAGV